MATGPDLTDPALQQLARLLVNKQSAIARPGVTVGATPPPLPPFQMPGMEMARFQPPIQPQAAPPVAPAAVPPAPAPMPQQMVQAPIAPPVAPAMPDTVPVGMDANADVRKAIEEMQRRAFQNAPAPWVVNQGNLRDQT